ncbi:Protein of unknown function [Cotesia congregata]|uniref:DNA primase large subunit C-terminal domain-containing protein n=1 Tax=Cotesia congregata TaxID=51543 RepID=A0A8J2HHB8_COTCN|nr:Protein of unknown function [Cotesia congregata]
MDVESFEKKYEYYIEHAYGLRRNSRDWDPKDCQKIQNVPTLAGNCNDCLLQITHITDIEDLDNILSQWKIPNSDKCDIIEKFKNGNSGAACAHYFHVINSFRMKAIIQHINDFFNRSRYAQNEQRISDFSRSDISTGIAENTTYNSENLEKDESVDFKNSTEDELTADVASDIKKRKADVAFCDCEVKISDGNKKVGTNSTDGIERIRVEFMDS